MSPPSLREAVVIVLGLLGFGAGVLAGYLLSGGDVGCFLGEDTMDVLAAIVTALVSATVSGAIVAGVSQYLAYVATGKRAYRDLVRTKRLEHLLYVQDAAATVREYSDYWQEKHQAQVALYERKRDELQALKPGLESRYPGMGDLIEKLLMDAHWVHEWWKLDSFGKPPATEFRAKTTSRDDAESGLRRRIDDILDAGSV
jgi:hypothetical protein